MTRAPSHLSAVLLALSWALPTAPAAEAPAQPATAPATRPAPRPTTVPAELTTPKGALRALNLALRDGDTAVIRQVVLAAGPEQERMVATMADFASALAALHRAAADAFGAEGAKVVAGDMEAESADGLAGIDRADVSIDGDTATVQYREPRDEPPDQPKTPPVKLRRVGEAWKLPASQLQQGADATAVEDHLTRLAQLTREARLMAAEIAAGKFKNADKAGVAWRTRALQAVAPRLETKPSTPTRDGPTTPTPPPAPR